MDERISFDDYVINRDEFGHVATWCVWPRAAEVSLPSPATDEDYEQMFGARLHTDVVVLTHSFRVHPDWSAVDDNARLSTLSSFPAHSHSHAIMGAQYAGPFAATSLWGAYSTPFFKFSKHQSSITSPLGVTASCDGDLVPWYLSEEGLALQAAGLRRELTQLGVSEHPVFALTSEELATTEVLQALLKEFPGMRCARLSHYQYVEPQELHRVLPDEISTIQKVISEPALLTA